MIAMALLGVGHLWRRPSLQRRTKARACLAGFDDGKGGRTSAARHFAALEGWVARRCSLRGGPGSAKFA